MCFFSRIKITKNSKYIFIILSFGLSTLLTSCGGSSTSGGASGSFSSGFFTSGQWLQDSCGNGGSGTSYKIYFKMASGTQYGGFLRYSTADCAGSYTLSSSATTTIAINEDSLVSFSTNNEALDITGTPENFVPFSFVGTYSHSVAYFESASIVWAPGVPANSNPGTTWADWAADGTLGAFIADYTTGIKYNKITSLP